MSSTNRGYKRHVTDYYITPHYAIKDFFNAWFVDLQSQDVESWIADKPDKVRWFDPCAGGSETEPMSYPTVITQYFNGIVDTMDIRQDSLADEKADYLETDIQHRKYDVIITNPPFYLAKEIIQKALNDVNEDGYVVMLLRLNFFGSNERKQFLQENMPKWCYVHSKRMSFTKDKKTDSIEYMHAVWKKGEKCDSTLLKII